MHKHNILIAAVLHVLIIFPLVFFAAHEGTLGEKMKMLTVGLVPKPKVEEIKPSNRTSKSRSAKNSNSNGATQSLPLDLYKHRCPLRHQLLPRHRQKFPQSTSQMVPKKYIRFQTQFYFTKRTLSLISSRNGRPLSLITRQLLK